MELSEINRRSIADMVRLILDQYLLDPYLEQQQLEQQAQLEERSQQPRSRDGAYRQVVADAENQKLREQQAADRNRLMRTVHR